MADGILLISVGPVPAVVRDWLTTVLPGAFALSCRPGMPLPHPSFAWDAGRRQYLADAVLARVDPAERACALAVADLDLCVAHLSFVFGLADHANRRTRIALPRLRQFYSPPEERDLFHKGVLNEAVHGLGHVFGLRHCDDRRCVMTFSSSRRIPISRIPLSVRNAEGR